MKEVCNTGWEEEKEEVEVVVGGNTAADGSEGWV